MNIDKLGEIREELESKGALEVKNYPAMCALLEEDVLEGSSKIAQTNEWKRYLRWERKGHKLIILEVLATPLPEPIRSDDIYSEHIMTVLSKELEGDGSARTCSTTQLMKLCGFVNSDWGNLELLADTPTILGTPKEALYQYSSLDRHVNQYCRNALMKSLKRLSERKLIHWGRKTLIYIGGVPHEANPEEEERYRKADQALRKEWGINYLSVYDRDGFYGELRKRLREEFGWDKTYPLHEIALIGERAGVTQDEHSEALRSINEHSLSLMKGYVDGDIEWKLGSIKEDIEDHYAEMSEGDAEIVRLLFSDAEFAEALYGDVDGVREIKHDLICRYIKI